MKLIRNIAFTFLMINSVARLQCEGEEFEKSATTTPVDRLNTLNKFKEEFNKTRRADQQIKSNRAASRLIQHEKSNADLKSSIDALKDSNVKLSWFGKVIDKVKNYVNKRSISTTLINHASSDSTNPPVLTEEQSKAFEKLSAKDKKDLANSWKEEHDRILVSRLKNEKIRFANDQNANVDQHKNNANKIIILHDMKTNSFSNWLKSFSKNEQAIAAPETQSNLGKFMQSLKEKTFPELNVLAKSYTNDAPEKAAILDEIKLRIRSKRQKSQPNAAIDKSATSARSEETQPKNDLEATMKHFGYEKPVEPIQQSKKEKQNDFNNLWNNFQKRS